MNPRDAANAKGCIDSVMSFTKTKLLPHVPEITIRFTHSVESGTFPMCLSQIDFGYFDGRSAKDGLGTTKRSIAAMPEAGLLGKSQSARSSRPDYLGFRGQPAFLDGVARNERSVSVDQLRPIVTTAVVGEGAARMKSAAGGRIYRVRHLTRHRLALSAGHLDARDRVEQQARIRVARCCKEPLGSSDFDEPPEIHDTDAVRHLIDDREIMRDEQIGQTELALQILHQVEDLRLDRDVEGRSRFVADEEFRVRGKGARDRDALA